MIDINILYSALDTATPVVKPFTPGDFIYFARVALVSYDNDTTIDVNPLNNRDVVLIKLDCDPVGTQTFDKRSLAIYPNPVDHVLNIDLGKISSGNNQSVAYFITNAIGQKIESSTLDAFGKATLNVAQYPSGMYYIFVHHAGQQVAVSTFVKN